MSKQSRILLSCALLLSCPLLWAQEAPESLIGSFEGSLVFGRDDLTIALTFDRQGDEYTAALTSANLGVYGFPAEVVQINGLRVLVRMPRLDAEFTGTLRLDESGEEILNIDGDWFQSRELVPVVLHPVDKPSF
jgi:hypothetical protein